jgi:hypothetical protein
MSQLQYARTVAEDISLMNILINGILMGYENKTILFDWSMIGRHSTIFSDKYNTDDAKALLQLSMAVTNTNFAGIPLNAPDWLQDIPIMYNVCPLRIISEGIPDSTINRSAILAHVLYSSRANIVFVVFTGTINACMAGLDLDYSQTEFTNILNYQDGMKGHRGIYTAYQSIRHDLIKTIMPYINNQAQLIITGHSLGAGLSNLCAFDLASYNPLHYSFASPLIFNPLGAEIFNKLVPKSYRIANLSDLVALSPLPIMPNGDAFCHVGTAILFQRNTGQYIDNHCMAYITEFDIPYIKT